MKTLLPTRRFVLATAAFAALSLAGCGGTTTTPATTLSVTPVLGATYGAAVQVFNNVGVLLGSGTTDATTGKANVTLVGYTSGTPVILKVALGAGSSYYDEKSGAVIAVTAFNPVSLLSVMPAVSSGQAVGVTPLTNMAAKLVGLTASAVGTAPLTTAITATNIYTAVAKTILALGLPSTTSLTAAPVAATLAAPVPATDSMGKILALMAKNSTSANAAAQADALVAAVNTDGTIPAGGAIAAVNTNLRSSSLAAAAGLTIAVAETITAPTETQLSNAVTATKTVIDAAVIAPPAAATGTGTGSTGAGS